MAFHPKVQMMNSYTVHFEFDIEVDAEDEQEAIAQAVEDVNMDGGVRKYDVEYVELLEEAK